MNKKYPKRQCPACKKAIGHGLAYYNHLHAHVRRGELVEITINGTNMFMVPGEVQQVEGDFLNLDREARE